jgi:hypothetical protein
MRIVRCFCEEMGRVVSITEATEFSASNGNVRLTFRCENRACKVEITGAAYIPPLKQYKVTPYFSRHSDHIAGCPWKLEESKSGVTEAPEEEREPKSKPTPTHVTLDLFGDEANSASGASVGAEPDDSRLDRGVQTLPNAGLHIRNLDDLVSHYERCSISQRQEQMNVRISGLAGATVSWDSLFRPVESQLLPENALAIYYGDAKIALRYGAGASFVYASTTGEKPLHVYVDAKLVRACPWGDEVKRVLDKSMTPLSNPEKWRNVRVYWVAGERKNTKQRTNINLDAARAFTVRASTI